MRLAPNLSPFVGVRTHGADKIIKTLQHMAIRGVTDRQLLEDGSEAFFDASDRLYPLQVVKGLQSFYRLKYSNEAILSSIVGRIEDILPQTPTASPRRILSLLSMFSGLNICHEQALSHLLLYIRRNVCHLEGELAHIIANLSQLLVHDPVLLNLLAHQALLTQKGHNLISCFEALTRHNSPIRVLEGEVTKLKNNISLKSRIKLLVAYNRLGNTDFNGLNEVEKAVLSDPKMLLQVSMWLNYYRLANSLSIKMNLIEDSPIPFQLLMLVDIVSVSQKEEFMRQVKRLGKIIGTLEYPSSVLHCLQICIYSEVKWGRTSDFTEEDSCILTDVANIALKILDRWAWALKMSEQRILVDLLLYLKSCSRLNVNLAQFTCDVSVPALLPLFPQGLQIDNLEIVQIGSKSYLSEGKKIYFYHTDRDRFVSFGGDNTQFSLLHTMRMNIINSLNNYILHDETI